MNQKLNAIEIGHQVYLNEGDDPFGAVRRVAPDGREEVVIYIENAGEFELPIEAVRSAHDAKVVLERGRLDERLLDAITHAHDREEPGL
jgi:hypothetical protein